MHNQMELEVETHYNININYCNYYLYNDDHVIAILSNDYTYKYGIKSKRKHLGLVKVGTFIGQNYLVSPEHLFSTFLRVAFKICDRIIFTAYGTTVLEIFRLTTEARGARPRLDDVLDIAITRCTVLD